MSVSAVEKTQLFVKIIYNMKIIAYIWAAVAIMAMIAVICGAWWHLFSICVSVLMCCVYHCDDKRQRMNEMKYNK